MKNKKNTWIFKGAEFSGTDRNIVDAFYVLNLNLGATKKTKSLFLFDQLSFQSVVIRPIKRFFSVPIEIADNNSKIGRKVPKHILFEHFVLQCEVASPGSQTVCMVKASHHTATLMYRPISD